MDKQAFLDALWQALQDLPQDDVLESLEYYEEILDDSMEDGMTEQEAVAQLGSPLEVAQRIRMDMPLTTLVRARAKRRHMRAWEIVLLILGSPVWLPVLLSVVLILLSVYIVIWAILICLYVVAAALAVSFVGAVGLAVWTIRSQDLLHGTFLLGCGLICGGLSILLFLVSKGLTRAVARGTASFVRKCKKRIVGKGSVS